MRNDFATLELFADAPYSPTPSRPRPALRHQTRTPETRAPDPAAADHRPVEAQSEFRKSHPLLGEMSVL